MPPKQYFIETTTITIILEVELRIDPQDFVNTVYCAADGQGMGLCEERYQDLKHRYERRKFPVQKAKSFQLGFGNTRIVH